MLRLSTIESCRVNAIFEEALEKLSFLGSINPDVLQHRDELSQIVGDEISRIIHDQRLLEQRYEKLISQRSELKGLANKSKFKENQNEIQAISRELRESTKNLCRNLKNNPNIGENLVKIQNERQSLIDLLSKTMEEMKDGTFTTLMNRVEEEKQAKNKVDDVVQREKQVILAVKNLDQELSQTKIDQEREVKEKKELIAGYKEKILHLKTKTQIDINYARKEANAKTNSTTRMYAQQLKDQESQIAQLESKLKQETLVHKESVKFLSAQHDRLVKQLEDWNSRYQTDSEAKEKELAEITQKREMNLQNLQVLQKRWDAEQELYRAQEQERRRLAELAALCDEESDKQTSAAIVIQTRVKEHLQAKAAKKASEKKSKKGKGKGKKGAKK